jgi:hypothetical protein
MAQSVSNHWASADQGNLTCVFRRRSIASLSASVAPLTLPFTLEHLVYGFSRPERKLTPNPPEDSERNEQKNENALDCGIGQKFMNEGQSYDDREEYEENTWKKRNQEQQRTYPERNPRLRCG